MEYYKMRMMIATDAKEFLATYPELSADDFCRSMAKKYGVTKKTVNSVLHESYGIQINGSELVKVNAADAL